jgi:hypothetical protein
MTTKQSIPQFTSAESILKSSCPVCGHSLTVVDFHVGGEGLVPFVTCDNLDGGYTHMRVRIPQRVAYFYGDLINGLAKIERDMEMQR